jgi:ribonucleoside-diphosphate reductase alpha chain
MRVIDPGWIGAKLRQIADYQEPRGDFLAWVPGEVRRQANYPSTVAYIASLVLHRYAMLGILDADGNPIRPMGAMQETGVQPDLFAALVPGQEVTPGKRCRECGSHAVIRKDGCDFCTACGATGACG